MVKWPSVAVTLPVGPAHLGQKWTQHERAELILENGWVTVRDLSTAWELYFGNVHGTVANTRSQFIPRRHFWIRVKMGRMHNFSRRLYWKIMIFYENNWATITAFSFNFYDLRYWSLSYSVHTRYRTVASRCANHRCPDWLVTTENLSIPLQINKQVKVLLYPLLPYFRKDTPFWEVPRLFPFVLLARATCTWRWTWVAYKDSVRTAQ